MEEIKTYCIKCGCEICGAHYNTPIGCYCFECWDKVPAKKKQQLTDEALRAMARWGGLFDK